MDSAVLSVRSFRIFRPLVHDVFLTDITSISTRALICTWRTSSARVTHTTRPKINKERAHVRVRKRALRNGAQADRKIGRREDKTGKAADLRENARSRARVARATVRCAIDLREAISHLAVRIANDNSWALGGRESPRMRPRTRPERQREGRGEEGIYGGESRASARIIIGRIAMRTDEL